LAFDGRIHHLEQGYWLKFEIARVPPTPERPHGLTYSFTLHDPDGARLIGFDNAHGVAARGSRFQKRGAVRDHWHRTGEDIGRPYAFTTADQLLADFFEEARRVLAARGIGDMVISTSESQKRTRQ
jgi:Family of unknown function (DUF6516)